MSTFTKDANGNVIYDDGTGKERNFGKIAYVEEHEGDNVLIIPANIKTAFIIDYNDVTSPSVASKQALFDELTQNFFFELSSKLQSSDGSVYVDTENATHSGQIVFKSSNTGTDYIAQYFEGTGTPVPVHQIDAEGNIYNNGKFVNVIKNSNSVFIMTKSSHADLTTASTCTAAGVRALSSIKNGTNNTAFGYAALVFLASGSQNCAFGANALYNTTGGQNVGIGYYAGYDNRGGALNVYIGYLSGFNNQGSNNLFIGSHSGYYQSTVSNRLVIDNIGRADAATELTDALIVGTFNSSVNSQEIYFNAKNIFMNYLPTNSIGLPSGQVWNNSNVLNIV